ncbi:hypothetical protein [Cellulosilyticum ruminicola]|nr:hypothetical protein [Cellulosilyticum ruminicola]
MKRIQVTPNNELAQVKSKKAISPVQVIIYFFLILLVLVYVFPLL